jgi:flagellar protein FlbD
MIELTLLNGSICWFHPDHILTMEATPDTVLRLSNGEKWLVKESCAEVCQRFIAYQHQKQRPEVPSPLSLSRHEAMTTEATLPEA